MKRVLIYVIIALLVQGCRPKMQESYLPDWEPPITSHSLLLPETFPMKILWEQQVFALSSALKNVQCASSKDTITLVGSQSLDDVPKVFALDGEDGALLWDFQTIGVLAYSDEELFIGFEEFVYSVQPETGVIKWQKHLPNIRNVTKMMYYDELIFVNGSGANAFYVLDVEGGIISKHEGASGFRSNYKDIPFYPTLPFNTVTSDDVLVTQTGSGLYYGNIYEKHSNKQLWDFDKNSISNFTIINDYIVWISSNDTIEVADIYNGSILASIKITPSIDFFNPNPNRQYFGYYLCGNSYMDNIYVILGDSRQIFAIKFLEQ